MRPSLFASSLLALTLLGSACTPADTGTSTATQPGLGVGRQAFVDTFTRDTFAFSAGAEIDGQENYVAQDDVIVMQLIGPADDLRSANISFISAGDDAALEDTVTRVNDFINLIDPSLAEEGWAFDQIAVVAESAGEADHAALDERNGNSFSFTYTAVDGIFQVAVQPAAGA